jgi:hypothetical protein
MYSSIIKCLNCNLETAQDQVINILFFFACVI